MCYIFPGGIPSEDDEDDWLLDDLAEANVRDSRHRKYYHAKLMRIIGGTMECDGRVVEFTRAEFWLPDEKRHLDLKEDVMLGQVLGGSRLVI